ncbi:MAG: hypothetical protein LBC53_06815 [Spirochaetaceae bacterium]|nr:hypothetical protein [Spirochaetaceae bacterium]
MGRLNGWCIIRAKTAAFGRLLSDRLQGGVYDKRYFVKMWGKANHFVGICGILLWMYFWLYHNKEKIYG